MSRAQKKAEVTPLRDGTVTTDPRLDRLVSFDKRSRNFGVASTIAASRPRSYSWRLCDILNQGNEGSCVGHGISHELKARPSEVKGVDHRFAVEKIYWPAQQIDDWPGGLYPGARPRYEGTSVLAGLKVTQAMGYFDAYRWAFGIDDLIMGVGYNGPAVLGINGYEGMQNTDPDGFIHVTGRVVGGHCALCAKVDLRRQAFRIPNSWGRGWGQDGWAWISFSDMDKLLRNQGEAAFPMGRHSVPRKVDT